MLWLVWLEGREFHVECKLCINSGVPLCRKCLQLFVFLLICRAGIMPLQRLAITSLEAFDVCHVDVEEIFRILVRSLATGGRGESSVAAGLVPHGGERLLINPTGGCGLKTMPKGLRECIREVGLQPMGGPFDSGPFGSGPFGSAQGPRTDINPVPERSRGP